MDRNALKETGANACTAEAMNRDKRKDSAFMVGTTLEQLKMQVDVLDWWRAWQELEGRQSIGSDSPANKSLKDLGDAWSVSSIVHHGQNPFVTNLWVIT